ncbi:MAG: discoidin domain-containing protein [Kiritimatiellae bacterium]|nr:discoidin domain-containing protein [Kiritimatiellia bacterium]
MTRKRKVWCCVSACVVLSLTAAVPTDGGVWTIGTGELETLTSGATVSRLLNDGTLTIGTGTELSITGAVLNAVGTETGKNGEMTIAGGATLSSQGGLTGDNPGNTQGFSIGNFGGTGVVTVASGGKLTVTGGRLSLGRNSPVGGGDPDRSRPSQGVLTIFGTVDAPTVECCAWFPTDTVFTDVDELPLGAQINIEEGGIFEFGQFYMQDLSLTEFNFRGGTLRAKRDNNNFINPGGALVWNIETGKNLVFDTNGHTVRIAPATRQHDFFRIRGEGGLVKKGAGSLQICNYADVNTFTGPITVEEGSLSIGRALTENQTVFVKKGASFLPAVPADLTKVTYEDPSDAPVAGTGLFSVESVYFDGLDLAGWGYDNDRLGGPAKNVNAEVRGTVIHADTISLDHPFGLVGQGYQLNLYDTGLESLPLTISGTSKFWFGGTRTDTADNAITFTGTGTYQQESVFAVQGANASTPTVTVSGGGTLATGEMRIGYDGANGTLAVKDGATVNVNGQLRIGGNTSDRQTVKGRVTVENATISVSDEIKFGPTSLTDGSDRDTVLNELVLGPGSNLKVGSRFTRNDDARSRIVFNGGTVSPQRDYSDFFFSGQDGIFEIEAKAGSNIKINLGTRSVGMISNHTHLFGDGGLEIVGTPGNPVGTFMLGKFGGLGDFTVDYKGATKISDATLRLGTQLPEGCVISGSCATVDIGGYTIDPPVGDVKVKGPGSVVVGRNNADVAFDCQMDGAQLLKVGTGTMTVGTTLGGPLTVKEGTAVINGAAAYSSYRFWIEANRGTEKSMQLSELVLYNGANDVTRPYKDIAYDTTADNNGSTYPANEAPPNLVDGNLTTKWLDWRAGVERSVTDHERVWLQINYDAPRVVTGYAWFTANDTTGRDPTAWRLQGSNDGGATWIDLDVQSGFTPTDKRRVEAGFFPISGDFSPVSVVSVAPGATLKLSGNVSVSSLGGTGTVELLDGATLSSGGGYLDGSVTGAGSLNVAGGKVTLTGAPTYTGETHVTAGTLDVGTGEVSGSTRAFDGKYFRLTIRRSNGGDNNAIQASEFELFNARGEMQNRGLTMQGVGVAATALAAGSFTCSAEYANSTGTGNEVLAKLFDGETSTKWFCGDNVNGDETRYHVITMRLADTAEPIESYTFYTANDRVRRSPTEWVLEGSRDGRTWELLDRRYWAPHTTFTTTSNNAENADPIKFKPFNNGTPYTFETDCPTVFNGKFLRFTFKKTVGNTLLQLSELMLIDILGGNAAKGLTEADNGTSPLSLTPGSFTCPANYYNGSKSEGPKYLFDDSQFTKLCSGSVNGDEANYRYVTIRLADDALPVTGYVLVTANDSLNRSPSDWMVEGSMDGETWVTLDERAGIAEPYCLYTAMNAGHPFTFDAYKPSASIPAESYVRVDTGAVVNLNSADAAIGALRVDCALGGGTINAFRPAAGGTLELVNLPADVTSLIGYEVPLTVNGLQNGAALDSWKVVTNGVQRDGVKIKVENNRLVFTYGGTIILLR